MDRYIMIECLESDTELISELNCNFGNELEQYNKKSIVGLESYILLIVPIIALTVQVVDFFLTHLCNKKDSKRFIFTKNGKISIEGFNANEVKDILETLL